MTRHRRFACLVVLAAIGALLAGCGGDDGESAAETTAPEAPRAFVGATSGSDEIVAVALLEGGRAEAYASDGKEVGEFFEGPVENGSLSLTSARGGRLEAAVSGDRVEGTFRARGGSPLPFEARANDEAAIYLVNVAADGTISGAATSGGRIDMAPGGSGVVGLATYPSGQELPLDGRVVAGQEIAVEELREQLVSGTEIELPGDRHRFSFYRDGEALVPRGSFAPLAGPYRFLLFDKVMVGGSTPDHRTREQILASCYPEAARS